MLSNEIIPKGFLDGNLSIDAHKKAGGSTKNGRDSENKILGVKRFGRPKVTAGAIISRQTCTKFHPSNNVGVGRYHILFALVDGTVHFAEKKVKESFPPIRIITKTLTS